MGTKYTVTAGRDNLHRYEYRTNCLLVALYKLFAIKVDYRAIYWKQLQVN